MSLYPGDYRKPLQVGLASHIKEMFAKVFREKVKEVKSSDDWIYNVVGNWIDGVRKQLLAKAFGLDYRYGSIEVGYSSEEKKIFKEATSPILEKMRQIAFEQIDGLEDIDLTEKEKERFRKAFRKAYVTKFLEEVEERATRMALDAVPKFLEETFGEEVDPFQIVEDQEKIKEKEQKKAQELRELRAQAKK